MNIKKYRDRRAAYMREWRKGNEGYAEKMRIYRANWRENNSDQDREAQRVNKERARQEVVDWFGGCCVKCGFSDWRALQIDHIHGGGLGDARTKQSPHFFRRWLNNHPIEAREHYQLLCANCNWIKRHENNEHYYGDRVKSVIVPWTRGDLYEHDGQSHTLIEWSKIVGISAKNLAGRINELGWSIEDALTKPEVRGLPHKSVGAKHRPLTFKGETLTIGQWADRLGLKWKTIYERVGKHGWSVEDALMQPAEKGLNLKHRQPLLTPAATGAQLDGISVDGDAPCRPPTLNS